MEFLGMPGCPALPNNTKNAEVEPFPEVWTVLKQWDYWQGSSASWRTLQEFWTQNQPFSMSFEVSKHQ